MPKKVPILGVKAREVLDSRGNPTVEAEVRTAKGVGRAAVPSGASTGAHEAVEKRDGGRRYGGKGVLKAVGAVNGVIARKLKGRDASQQVLIDETLQALDGTPDKSHLGANALLAVSMACCRAAAQAQGKELHQYLGSGVTLPVPFFNVINGGKHAGGGASFQEYMLAPVGVKSFSQALQAGAECYHELKKRVAAQYGPSAVNVGDEGGFAVPAEDVEKPLEMMAAAAEETGWGRQMAFALDVAATSFFGKGTYLVGGKKFDAAGLAVIYVDLVKKFPIVSIEDPFYEEDFASFSGLTGALGREVQVVGDDLLVTNARRIRTALSHKACNGLLFKLNQAGLVTEAVDAAGLAYSRDWGVMVSHRSGETEDAFISDLAVGLSFGQMKSGAPARGERTAKYNQLLRIEETLGSKARYSGRSFRRPVSRLTVGEWWDR